MAEKKVDLQCPCCYKKVKKILCEFPQIRDQFYDEKANTVTITVVCCNPEKIRDKLCCKGSKVIKSIEIKKPPPKKEKPEEKPEEKPPEKPPPAQNHPPHTGCPPKYPVPVRTCCGPCSEGNGGGPCYYDHGVPPPPQPCYVGYYGYGYWQSRGCHVSRCDYYICEENPQGCSIM